MEIYEVFERYDQTGTGELGEDAFLKALAEPPLKLGLEGWKVKDLWRMIAEGLGLWATMPQDDGPSEPLPSQPQGTGLRNLASSPDPSGVQSMTREGSVYTEIHKASRASRSRDQTLIDVISIARAFLHEADEDVWEAIRVLRDRLVRINSRLLPILNRVDVDGSGAIPEKAFRKALGVGGLAGINLSDLRLRRIWAFLDKENVGYVDTREAAALLEPPGSSYPDDLPVTLTPLEQLLKERDELLELLKTERHRLFQYEECLAIAVRRLKIIDREWGTNLGRGLLGPISEGGRIGTATNAKSVMTYLAGGEELHKDTLAISVAPLVLEEAIWQLDAYNLRVKQGAGKSKKQEMEAERQALLQRNRREALRLATSVLDELYLRTLWKVLPKPSVRDLQVKIYISAHADDFERERQGLNSYNAFRALKNFLLQRSLSPVLVDLRPGRKETIAPHSSMDLMLLILEIRSCWAFIALLGPNYGGQVKHAATSALALRDEYHWVQELAGRSLTEVEISTAMRFIYSDDKAMLRHALIYIRSDASGADSAEDALRWVRQRQLLEDVQVHRGNHCRYYDDSPEMVRHASIELAKYAKDEYEIIEGDGEDDSLFKPPPFWRGEAQAATRSKLSLGFVDRPDRSKKLDEYLTADPELPPLVVVGNTGSGKSALLRSWSSRVATRGVYKEKASVVAYFGTDSREPQPVTGLLQIMCDLKRRKLVAPSDHVRAMASKSVRESQLRDMKRLQHNQTFVHREEVLYGRSLPISDDEILDQFRQWCEIAGTKRQLVCILDFMDTLAAPAKAAPWDRPSDLWWIPQHRVHTRMILGLRVDPGGLINPSAPGGDEAAEALRCFRRWNWPIIEVKGLSDTQRDTLVHEVLQKRNSSAAILDEQLDMDLRHNTAAITLFLHLTTWAPTVTLNIASASQTMHQLCDWLLLSWEGACAEEAPGLVQNCFRLLFVARQGISQAELVDLVRSGRKPIPTVVIARFFFIASPVLSPMSERNHFTLRPMREAVKRAYLPRQYQEATARLYMAAYFADTEFQHSIERVSGELPWQLHQVGCWNVLRDAVTAMPVFMCLWAKPEGVADLTHYWSKEGLGSRFEIVNVYLTSLNNFLISEEGLELRKTAHLEHIASVARLFHLFRELESAEIQYNRAIDMSFELYGVGHARSVMAVREYASVLYDMQRHQEGLDKVDRAIEMCEELPLLYVRIHDGTPLVARPEDQAEDLVEIDEYTGRVVQASAAQAQGLVVDGFHGEAQDAETRAHASGIGRFEGEKVIHTLGDEGPLIIALMGREAEEASACWELKGRLTRGLGRYDESVECFQKAVTLNEVYYYLEMWNNTLIRRGPVNGSLAVQLISFSKALYRQGRHDREKDCEAMLRHAAKVLEVALGPDHPDVASHAFMALADLYGQGMGRWVDAFDVLEKAVKIYTKAFGADHKTTKATQKLADEARKNMLESRAYRKQPPVVSTVGIL